MRRSSLQLSEIFCSGPSRFQRPAGPLRRGMPTRRGMEPRMASSIPKERRAQMLDEENVVRHKRLRQSLSRCGQIKSSISLVAAQQGGRKAHELPHSKTGRCCQQRTSDKIRPEPVRRHPGRCHLLDKLGAVEMLRREYGQWNGDKDTAQSDELVPAAGRADLFSL